MLTINGSTPLDYAVVSESLQNHNQEWVKVLVVKFPKEQFTIQQAIDKVKDAKTITDTDEYSIRTYCLNGVMTAKEDDCFVSVWLFIGSRETAENPNVKITSLEQQIIHLEQDSMESQQTVTDLELENIQGQQYATKLELELLKGGIEIE